MIVVAVNAAATTAIIEDADAAGVRRHFTTEAAAVAFVDASVDRWNGYDVPASWYALQDALHVSHRRADEAAVQADAEIDAEVDDYYVGNLPLGARPGQTLTQYAG